MSRYKAAERIAIESRRVEKVYAVLARVYDNSFDWALRPGRRRAIERLGIRPGDRVLEVGVGTGLSFPHYPAGARITGIDISPPMLEQARERAEVLGLDVDLLMMDAHDLDLPDASFDHVLAPYVISVVAEPEQVMRGICRVCRPGDTVVVVNHFRSRNLLLRTLEELATPMTRWIGFRMDVPAESVRRTPGLEVVDIERVNLLRQWQLLEMRRT